MCDCKNWRTRTGGFVRSLRAKSALVTSFDVPIIKLCGEGIVRPPLGAFRFDATNLEDTFMAILLIVRNGKHAGQEIKLEEGHQYVIGRGDECALKISSERVSRRHCELTVRDGGVLLRDLGSSNGTFVNGRQLEAPRQLGRGNMIAVGPLVFEVATRFTPASDDEGFRWIGPEDALASKEPGGPSRASDTHILTPAEVEQFQRDLGGTQPGG